jgi:hypothetical protein
LAYRFRAAGPLSAGALRGRAGARPLYAGLVGRLPLRRGTVGLGSPGSRSV